ncbi:hypothetical protein TRFO_37244 [Tritrichomonas foetus]|uniref:Uncharacterized protein n=1 Tax=Tritrichomonas foetus TaxID=1144522 RepID=A0A1J4JBR3_9EUKA|nr:hypothetical protein TRFO_37244 [Tritrichomonas foetus]|eukprot:OHS96584.1 hypothetical protein TRFO_37244 [Tritrichomonas foetus]
MLNELKKKKSPKKKGKRVRKRILSPTQKQKQQVETRDIDLDYEYDDNDYNIDYDDDEFNEVLENQEQAEEPVKETQKKGISKWMFLAVFLIFLVAGTAAFIFISPPRAFNALKTGLFGSSALAASSADGEINLDTESLNDTIINENVQADITESEENETGDLQKVLDGVEKVIENSENQTEAQNETENALENETAEQAETDNENTETVQQ